MPVYFISAIDTGVGKTIVCGLIARYLLQKGKQVITQKLVQTGCLGRSEDILKHREIMGWELTKDDSNGTTCPYVFKYPASPHLAASLENTRIDSTIITAATNQLLNKFEYVILEGAGGLCVPLNTELSTLDYIQKQNYPVILVTSGRLGSINHTLLSLEIAQKRNVKIAGLVFNQYPEADSRISNDSKMLFENYLTKNIPLAGFIEIPFVKSETVVDFGKIV